MRQMQHLAIPQEEEYVSANAQVTNCVASMLQQLQAVSATTTEQLTFTAILVEVPRQRHC